MPLEISIQTHKSQATHTYSLSKVELASNLPIGSARSLEARQTNERDQGQFADRKGRQIVHSSH